MGENYWVGEPYQSYLESQQLFSKVPISKFVSEFISKSIVCYCNYSMHTDDSWVLPAQHNTQKIYKQYFDLRISLH